MTDNIISRARASELIPQDALEGIIKSATENSVFLSLARRLRNMRSNEMRMSILTELPEAYFVDGEAGEGDDGLEGLKRTTTARWNGKMLTAEELAVIVPIHQNVLDDAEYNLWGEVSPYISQAMGRVIDRAVIHGENAPASWPLNIGGSCATAGHVVLRGSGVDLYEEILGEDGLVGLLEEDGYFPNGYASQVRMRAQLRSLRDSNGVPIFNYNTMQAATQYFMDGEPIVFPRNGSLMPSDAILMICADWTEFVYSIRTDIRMKMADEAVITDASGNIVRNLFQQDMVALRVTWRLGWQVANPPSPMHPDTAAEAAAVDYVGSATRYPASILAQDVYS